MQAMSDPRSLWSSRTINGLGFREVKLERQQKEEFTKMRNPSLSRGLAMVLALSGLALIPVAAAQPEASFATMVSAGTSVYWTTAESSGELSLSVTGPGFAVQQVSAGDGSPSMTLTRGDGNPLLDGIYNWEIHESFPGINDGVYEPANGRDVAAPSAQRPVVIEGRVASGVFTIKNGFVVDSTVTEADGPAETAGAGKESQ